MKAVFRKRTSGPGFRESRQTRPRAGHQATQTSHSYAPYIGPCCNNWYNVVASEDARIPPMNKGTAINFWQSRMWPDTVLLARVAAGPMITVETYVFIYRKISISLSLHLHMHLYTYMYMHNYIKIDIYIRIYIYMYMCTRISPYLYLYLSLYL